MKERRREPAHGGKDRTDRASASVLYTLSEEETSELGRTLAGRLRANQVVLLEGDLGLGKTVFARGIATGLGVLPAEVSSPSFTLINEYRGGRIPMFHVDLYRIADAEELTTLGLEDYFTAGGVVVIEWGERLSPSYRRDAIVVRFHDIGEGSRRIELIHPAVARSGSRSDA